jgi:L-alanine-DL-glutamate epimerase-like enolase superfamily enzyme
VRIERFEVHPIAIPLVHPYRDSTRVETHSRDVLVHLISDDGTEGWGAGTPRRFPTGETQVGTVHVLERVLADIVLGADAADPSSLWTAMERAIPANFAAKVAVDTALHDLLGRTRGVPVHRLLGEQQRTEMPTLDILPLESPDRMAAIAADLHVRFGTRAFKIKIDRDIDAGVQRVEAVRAAVPDAMLVVDANGAWSVEQALAACERLARLELRVLEQPTPGNDLDALAEVTRQSPIPIAADESAQPAFVDRLIATRAAHVVNVKLTREGGFGAALDVARRAHAAGMDVVCGSVVQSSLVDAACAHLFAVLPAVAYNESGKGPAWHSEDVAMGLRLQDGIVHVPDGPGLGMAVDAAAVRRLRPTD